MGSDFQDPGSTVRHEFDWTRYLSPALIASSAWAVSPTGPTLADEARSGYFTSVEVSGIADGGIYELENAVTLTTGEVERRSITLHGGSQ